MTLLFYLHTKTFCRTIKHIMTESREALIVHEGFFQPPSVVERFLHFTEEIFPKMVVEGAEFARPNIEADARRIPRFYSAGTTRAALASKEEIGSDALIFSVANEPIYFPGVDRDLTHRYYPPSGKGMFTSYSVFKGRLLAFDVRDVAVNNLTTDENGKNGRYIEGSQYYRSRQSVAHTLGMRSGFVRGLVDLYVVDEIGEIHDRRNIHELVGEEELEALLGLYKPA